MFKRFNIFNKKQPSITQRPVREPSFIAPAWWKLLLPILLFILLLLVFALWKPWQPVKAGQFTTSADMASQEMNMDYQFYSVLPTQKVTPIPEHAITNQQTSLQQTTSAGRSVNANSDDAKKAHYILLIKSYNNPDQADAKRAEIILSGVNANIIMDKKQQQIWYRVVSDRFENYETAQKNQQILHNSGIDSILTKVNDTDTP